MILKFKLFIIEGVVGLVGMVGMVGKRYERNKGHQNKVRNYTQHGGSESQQTDKKIVSKCYTQRTIFFARTRGS